jgi:hypothetical protein
VFHDHEHTGLGKELLFGTNQASRRLQRRLEALGLLGQGLVHELQCVELTADFKDQQQRPGTQQPQSGPQKLSWLKNVSVQDVQPEGPGSRAYKLGQRLQAVAPTTSSTTSRSTM